LEGDLDSPAATATIGVDVPMSAGLSQQLEGLMHNDPPRPINVLRCSPSLHVLGESVIRSPGIVLSVVFELAISTFRGYFDVIVIDGPPAVPSLDLRAIDALVDGVVFADPTLKPSSLGLTPPPGPAVRGLFGDKRLLIAVPA
jgi:Mrp family chromosome partitioning ATPase